MTSFHFRYFSIFFANRYSHVRCRVCACASFERKSFAVREIVPFFRYLHTSMREKKRKEMKRDNNGFSRRRAQRTRGTSSVYICSCRVPGRVHTHAGTKTKHTTHSHTPAHSRACVAAHARTHQSYIVPRRDAYTDYVTDKWSLSRLDETDVRSQRVPPQP